MTDDTLLELCFAVALPAIASGIVFNIGASTGGTEIVAMILHKYIKVEIGRALLLSDIGTVLFAAYLYGPQTGMYCVLGLIGRSTIVDTAHREPESPQGVYGHHLRPEPIRHFVTETLGRTATQQTATGVYTGEPRTMIMVALTRRQAGLLPGFPAPGGPGGLSDPLSTPARSSARDSSPSENAECPSTVAFPQWAGIIIYGNGYLR